MLAKYLISSPSAAMVVPDGDWETVGRDSHAVIGEGRWRLRLRRGIDEAVPPALVSADGAVAESGYPWAPPLDGSLLCSNYPRVRRGSPGPRGSRRPAAATRNCASFSLTQQS